MCLYIGTHMGPSPFLLLSLKIHSSLSPDFSPLAWSDASYTPRIADIGMTRTDLLIVA